MSDRVELVWYGDDAPPYDHRPTHPLRPARVTLTRSHRACGGRWVATGDGGYQWAGVVPRAWTTVCNAPSTTSGGCCSPSTGSSL